MTSLAAALSCDSRGPSALYLITDSRITWAKSTERWDAGQKTFTFPNSPDIFGYCGDAYFAPIVMGQVISIAMNKVIDFSAISSECRHKVIIDIIKESIGKVNTIYISDVTLFHGSRDECLMESRFRLWRSQYNCKSHEWIDKELVLNNGTSYLAKIDGSGASSVKKFDKKMLSTDAKGTSRAAIHAFCKSLHSGADAYSGGAPQLVGIWRKGNARQFGISWDGKGYIGGMKLPKIADYSQVDWFNHLFERCDGRTGRKLEKASNHKLSLQSNNDRTS